MTLPPSARACSIAAFIRSSALAVISGPTSVPASSGLPIGSVA